MRGEPSARTEAALTALAELVRSCGPKAQRKAPQFSNAVEELVLAVTADALEPGDAERLAEIRARWDAPDETPVVIVQSSEDGRFDASAVQDLIMRFTTALNDLGWLLGEYERLIGDVS